MLSMKKVQYETNKDFPHVYNAIGESSGLIPVRIEGSAMNLHVNRGDWILYKKKEVAVISDADYTSGVAPVFHRLR
jgi:hypothetical protein